MIYDGDKIMCYGGCFVFVLVYVGIGNNNVFRKLLYIVVLDVLDDVW